MAVQQDLGLQHGLRGEPGATLQDALVEPQGRGDRAGPRTSPRTSSIVEDFEPEVVISDFETWTYLYAKRHRLPIISIDNMQIINRCTHAPEILAGTRPTSS